MFVVSGNTYITNCTFYSISEDAVTFSSKCIKRYSYISAYSKLNILSSFFKDTKAHALNIQDSHVDIHQSNFTNNGRHCFGSGLYFARSKGNISMSDFNQNQLSVIRIEKPSLLNINNSIFSNNYNVKTRTGKGLGGVLYSRHSGIHIYNSIFSQNEAFDGSVFYIIERSMLSLKLRLVTSHCVMIWYLSLIFLKQDQERS